MEKLYSVIWNNELIFSITIFFWMIFTALGGLTGRKEISEKSFFLMLLTLIPILLFMPDLIKSFNKNFVKIFSLSETLLITLLITAPAGFLTGLGFVTLSRLFSYKGSKATSLSYLYESAGSFSGALLTYFLLYYGIGEESAILFSGIIVAIFLTIIFKNKNFAFVILFYILLLLIGPIIKEKLWEKNTKGTLQATIRGELSQLTIITKNGSSTLYGGYFPIYTFPDPSKIRTILIPQFIKGKREKNFLLYSYDAPNFTYSPEKPFLVRPDPALRKIEKFSDLPAYSGPVYYGDVYDFLKKVKKRYNIIEISLNSIPSTILDERFFSDDFFKMVKVALNKKGLLIYKLEETKNFPDDAEEYALSTMRGAGEKFFRFSYLFPFDDIYLVFSDSPIDTAHFCEGRKKIFYGNPDFYQILGLCNNSLIEFYNDIKPVSEKKHPYIYLMGVSHWEIEVTGKKFLFSLLREAHHVNLFSIIMLTTIFLLILAGKKNSASNFIVTGFTGLFLEITILYLFQYRFGLLFLHIALLMGVFMFSLSAGAFLSLRISYKRSVTLLLAFIGIPLLVFSHSVPSIYIGTFLLFSSFGIIFSEGALSKFSFTSDIAETSSFAEVIDHVSGGIAALSSPFILSSVGLTGGLIIVILLVVIMEITRK